MKNIVVFKVDFPHDKGKQEVVKKLSGLLDGTRWLWRWGFCNGTPAKAITGVDSIEMDMKDKKLTMIGDIDPLTVGAKLRKVCRNTEMVTFGPAKEPNKKKEEPKKEEPNKNKVVFKVDFPNDKGKQEVVKKLSGLLNGVDYFAMDMKDKKLTMIGNLDAVTVGAELKKVCHTELLKGGPAKEPDKKKEEPKKEELKKARGDDKEKDVGRRKM